MALTAALPARARFFLLLLPRMLAGRCTVRRFAGYAVTLKDAGSERLAAWCWRRVVRKGTGDEATCNALLDLCLQAGQHRVAEELAATFFDRSGLMPAVAVRLIGNLAAGNAFDSASRFYERLLRHCGPDLPARCPAPTWANPVRADELQALLAQRPEDGTASAMHRDLQLARLCFTFGAFDACATLYERVSAPNDLEAEDRIARAYALLRLNAGDRERGDAERALVSCEAQAANPDWQILRATVLFDAGAVPAAASAVETAMRTRFANHPEVDRIVADCRAMVHSISACPAVLAFRADRQTERAPEPAAGIRKIFICGNGWSGSGALYDALSEYGGLAEAPNTPIDRYINRGTDNEMMFVQGPAGLGRLWREAKREGKLSRLDLWELLRCHVLCGGAVGFSEHKSAKTAASLLTHFGSRYTAAFRKACDAFAGLRDGATLAELRNVLTETTESLTAVITGRREGECALFNNAVFGANVDMLEIFRNFRAAVVVRDPLDQYADRRAQDLKHWMTAGRFVPLYRQSRLAFHARKMELHPEQAGEIREIEFERFVRDEEYRESTIEWLLEGQKACRGPVRRFWPERSARNIGIHAKLLAPGEREVLEKELKRWRRS